jgi:hypothetical protein
MGVFLVNFSFLYAIMSDDIGVIILFIYFVSGKIAYSEAG